MLKRMIFYVYNRCTKIYIVTDGFINTVTHGYEELTKEEIVIAIDKAIGKLISEIGIDINEYAKDYDEIYQFVDNLMSEFNLSLKNYDEYEEETFMNYEFNKDVYIAIMNKKGALLGIEGVSGYIEYSHGKFTTSIKQLADLVNMRVGESK